MRRAHRAAPQAGATQGSVASRSSRPRMAPALGGERRDLAGRKALDAGTGRFRAARPRSVVLRDRAGSGAIVLRSFRPAGRSLASWWVPHHMRARAELESTDPAVAQRQRGQLQLGLVGGRRADALGSPEPERDRNASAAVGAAPQHHHSTQKSTTTSRRQTLQPTDPLPPAAPAGSNQRRSESAITEPRRQVSNEAGKAAAWAPAGDWPIHEDGVAAWVRRECAAQGARERFDVQQSLLRL